MQEPIPGGPQDSVCVARKVGLAWAKGIPQIERILSLTAVQVDIFSLLTVLLTLPDHRTLPTSYIYSMVQLHSNVHAL